VGFWGAKQDGQCYYSDKIDSCDAEAIKGLHRLFELLLAHFFEGRQKEYFYLAAIVDKDSRNVQFINVDDEDHSIGLGE
jgi:hypothetical protein